MLSREKFPSTYPYLSAEAAAAVPASSNSPFIMKDGIKTGTPEENFRNLGHFSKAEVKTIRCVGCEKEVPITEAFAVDKEKGEGLCKRCDSNSRSSMLLIPFFSLKR